MPYGTGEFESLMAKIGAKKPALLYFEVPSPPDMLTFLRAFKDAPTKTILNFGYGMQMQDFVTSAGAEADGVIGLTPGQQPPQPASNSAMNDWMQKAAAEYGHPLTGVGPSCYAAVMMWAKAVEAAGDPTKYDAVNQYLASQTFEEAVPGWVPLKFTDFYIAQSTTGSRRRAAPGWQAHHALQPGSVVHGLAGTETAFQTPSWIK